LPAELIDKNIGGENMPTALITGANKGLGLEHVRQFAQRGWTVIACTRKPGTPQLVELVKKFGHSVRIHALDVTDHAAVDRLADQLRDTSIDILVNNAGTIGPLGAPECMAYQGLDNMDYGIWQDILTVNLFGAFKVATAFRGHIAASDRRLLVNMSSDLGSVAQNETGKIYAYRSSKAGLNIVSKGMSVEWSDIIVVAMAPGWCQTEMGGEGATIVPADSVHAQQQTFEQLSAEDSGRYLDRFGATLPW
jgi:NAD(P)-dependent dehydrogenase (short-subunit alcohol dehydrogenase family)